MAEQIIETYSGIANSCRYKEELLLSCSVEYPHFISPELERQLKKINKEIKLEVAEYLNFCTDELFGNAVDQYIFSQTNRFPVRIFEALLTYQTKFLSDCILSLSFDKYEYTGGAHGSTIRYSQTFNIRDGNALPLSAFIKNRCGCSAYIFDMMRAQIKREPAAYFENADRLVVSEFDKNNYYCVEHGIIIYYQQYAIAPYSSGIREFFIPFGKCVNHPQDICR